MRITGGELSGRVIPAKFAKHVRPTTDRVRESIFNFLLHKPNFNLHTVLDLFAGSGIIALECLSQGASQVTSVDFDSTNINAMQLIKKNWELPTWHLQKQNVFSFLKNNTTPPYSLIFADPPYNLDTVLTLPAMCLPLLEPNGFLIIEHKPNLVFNQTPNLVKAYGSSICSIFVND